MQKLLSELEKFPFYSVHAMDVSRLEEVFKKKLRNHFPNMESYVLSVESNVVYLQFMNYRISASFAEFHDTTEFLFAKAAEMVDSLYKASKKRISAQQQKRRLEFQDSCVRQQINKSQAASVEDKVTFMKEEKEPFKMFKSCGITTPQSFYRQEQSNSLSDLSLDTMECGPVIDYSQLCEDSTTSDDRYARLGEPRDQETGSYISSGRVDCVGSPGNSIFVQSLDVHASDCKKHAASGTRVQNFVESAFPIVRHGLMSIEDSGKIVSRDKDGSSPKNSSGEANQTISHDYPHKSVSVDSCEASAYDLFSVNLHGSLGASGVDQNWCMATPETGRPIGNQSWSSGDLLDIPRSSAPDLHTSKSSVAVQRLSGERVPPSFQDVPDQSPSDFTNASRQEIAIDGSSSSGDAHKTIQSRDEGGPSNFSRKSVPDTSHMKKIMADNQNRLHGSISTVRNFCTHYKILPPEFETVRENDVFRCTAIFVGINFVSSYEYDKLDAKNDSCKKIVEYVVRNWEKIFEHDKCFL